MKNNVIYRANKTGDLCKFIDYAKGKSGDSQVKVKFLTSDKEVVFSERRFNLFTPSPVQVDDEFKTTHKFRSYERSDIIKVFEILSEFGNIYCRTISEHGLDIFSMKDLLDERYFIMR